MKTFVCDVCERWFSSVYFGMPSPYGDPICVFCMKDVVDIPREPDPELRRMREELAEDLFRATLETDEEEEDEGVGTYFENPHHAAGIDKFTINPDEVQEGLNLVAFVSDVLEIVFRQSEREEFRKLHDLADGVVRGIRDRMQKKLIEEPERFRIVRRSPLIFTGYEAKIFLTVLTYIHKRYMVMRTKYLDVKGYGKETGDFFWRMLWHVGAMIRWGTLGREWRVISPEEIRKKIEERKVGW